MTSQHVQVETAPNPRFCVIWLHGLGADGYDFVPVVKELEKLQVPGARYIFPHAPEIPVSINGGYVMRAWYDIKHVDLKRQEDERGIRESTQFVLDLIEAQIQAGFSSEQIVLAGFSQGGAIAYSAALRCQKPLCGLIALSTYLPLADTLDREASECSKNLSIFAAHGTNDQIVPPERGQLAVQILEKKHYSVQWHTYPMEHAVCGEEIIEIGEFLKSCFTAQIK